MSVLTGKSFTVTAGATDYSGQTTGGNIERSAESETIQTLAGSETVSQGTEDTASIEFLYDGGSGFYAAMWTAAGTGTPVSVAVVGGDGQWTGDLVVTSLSDEFPADGASTCTVEFAGALEFDTVTP